MSYPDICNPNDYTLHVKKNNLILLKPSQSLTTCDHAGTEKIAECVNLDPDFKCICKSPYANHPDFPASRCQIPSCPPGKRLLNEQNCQWVGRSYHTVRLDCSEACSDECNENETLACKTGQICRLNLETNPVCECPVGTFFDDADDECLCAGRNEKLENGK